MKPPLPKVGAAHDVHDLFPYKWTSEGLFEVFRLIMQRFERTDCFCLFDGKLENVTELIKSL
jgi:hypothetical protein